MCWFWHLVIIKREHLQCEVWAPLLLCPCPYPHFAPSICHLHSQLPLLIAFRPCAMLFLEDFFSSYFLLLYPTCPLQDHSHPHFHSFPSLWASSRIPTMQKWHQMLRHWLISKWQFVCACVCERGYQLTLQPIWDLADSCYLFPQHKYVALTYRTHHKAIIPQL